MQFAESELVRSSGEVVGICEIVGVAPGFGVEDATPVSEVLCGGCKLPVDVPWVVVENATLVSELLCRGCRLLVDVPWVGMLPGVVELDEMLGGEEVAGI